MQASPVSVRWFVHVTDDAWTLSPVEFETLCCALSEDEATRIGKQRKEEDKLRSLVGRMLLRDAACKVLGKELFAVQFGRTKGSKPYINEPEAAHRGLNENVSHHGDWVVLGMEERGLVGVDVSGVQAPRPNLTASYFFRDMERELTREEWSFVKRFGKTDSEQFYSFFVLWALKEAYTKATGVGIALPFQRLRLVVPPDLLSLQHFHQQPAGQRLAGDANTRAVLDGKDQPLWQFEIWKLDNAHVMAVAVGPHSVAVASWQEAMQRLRSNALPPSAPVDLPAEFSLTRRSPSFITALVPVAQRAPRHQTQPEPPASNEPPCIALMRNRRQAAPSKKFGMLLRVGKTERRASIKTERRASIKPERRASIKPERRASIKPERRASIKPERRASIKKRGSIKPGQPQDVTMGGQLERTLSAGKAGQGSSFAKPAPLNRQGSISKKPLVRMGSLARSGLAGAGLTPTGSSKARALYNANAGADDAMMDGSAPAAGGASEMETEEGPSRTESHEGEKRDGLAPLDVVVQGVLTRSASAARSMQPSYDRDGPPRSAASGVSWGRTPSADRQGPVTRTASGAIGRTASGDVEGASAWGRTPSAALTQMVKGLGLGDGSTARERRQISAKLAGLARTGSGAGIARTGSGPGIARTGSGPSAGIAKKAAGSAASKRTVLTRSGSSAMAD